jgi:hypothetical protein
MRPISLCVLRPSRDLTHLARAFEVKLQGFLNFLTTSLGSADTRSPEWLSMILFQREYVEQLMEVGYEDARAQHERLESFFAEAAGAAAPRRRVTIGAGKGLLEEALDLPKPSILPPPLEEAQELGAPLPEDGETKPVA